MSKNIKKLITIALCLCVFSFVGCGKDKSKDTTDDKNNTEVTDNSQNEGDFDFEKDIIEEDPNEEPEIVQYEWSGEYYLKNGTGTLKINKVDEKNINFSIEGKTDGDGKELQLIEGNAAVSEDIGTYQGEDGTIISFIFVQSDSVEIRVYDVDKNEIFTGVYLPN